MVKKKRQLSKTKLSEEQSPQSQVVAINTKPLGSYGTKSNAGYTDEEYFQTLRGKSKADVFDKMHRSSPQVAMLLSAVSSIIKAATWEVHPCRQDDAEADKDAELAKYILFEGMSTTWEDFINDAMTLPKYGVAAFEMVDKIIEAPEIGMINGLDTLAWRSPKTIEKFNLNSVNGKLESITQVAYGDLNRYVDIPAEFLMVMTLNKEGANYEGISMLRPCYGPWFRQNNYFKMNAAGIENFAVPAPIVTVPNGKESGDQFDNMVAALEAWAFHEKRYLTIPEGWTVDFNSNTYDPQKVEISIDNEDKRMAKAFIANFLELGMNGFGSQSLSVDLSDFFLNSLQHIANMICSRINQVVIPRMIKLNRGPRLKYPYIKACGITDKAGAELANVIKTLVDGRVIMPDAILEANMRERYGLPEASLDDQRQAPAPVAPGQPEEPENEEQENGDDEIEPKEPTPKLSEFLRKYRAKI